MKVGRILVDTKGEGPERYRLVVAVPPPVNSITGDRGGCWVTVAGGDAVSVYYAAHDLRDPSEKELTEARGLLTKMQTRFHEDFGMGA
ncbi:hypothetical protein ACN20G_23650 [Streptomyces sp. BI20]|uniref:hypothetical protein n=1 Tax=Streptomyces sp. BI20 TaxID=3403460 RepID=UPI003C77FE2D